MKILHVNFGILQGGIDNMLMDLMRFQLRQGHIVSLLVVNRLMNENVMSLLPEGGELYVVGRPESSKNPFYILKAVYLINTKIKPDLLHCHHGDLGFFLMLDRHPKILTVHAMQLPTKYYKYFDYICCISQAVMTDVLTRYHTDNISVVYNSVDYEAINRTRDEFKSNCFNILTIGRLVHQDKGQDLVIKAMKILKDKGCSVHLTLVGNGKSLEYLQKLTNNLQLMDDVTFLGERRRDWIYQHMCEYDLLVVPSRNEGFGLTIVEGVFAGLPVLVSDIDGPREVVQDGKYGYIFKSDSEHSLANQIEQISSKSRNTLKEENERNVAYYKTHFNSCFMAETYLSVYRKLLDIK
ncbi:MAG: glycosyltransferase [Prevotella sp.]|nr:glycosyltransferase [Prevotella sp.]